MKHYIAMVVVFLGLGLVESCYGLTITKPSSGSVFHPGDKVLVKVEPSANENLKAVFIFAGKIGYSTIDLFAPYELEFVIDNNFVGTDKIVASGKLVDGTIIETEIEFKVVLPATVKLDSLEIDPALLFLQKLPVGSDPNKIRIYGTERIGVAGVYSDGYKRDIAPSMSGTTYRSSDDSIVIVDSEGLATAKAPGRAKIFISNSGKEVSADVIVKNVTN